MPEVLGIITARGGSKGLPNKNILPLGGKPLIAHSVEAGLNAKLLNRLIVSTDHNEIAATARRFGAEVPFTRPAELAQDDTLIYPVLAHALRWLDEQDGYWPDYVMLLQPTSPLRTSEDIDRSVQLAVGKNADCVISLCETQKHPYWTKQITEDGRIADFMTLDQPLEKAYSRRQDLPEAYSLNGAIYLIRPQVLLDNSSFYTSNTYAYVMPPERSLDIDTAWDFYLAELVLNNAESRPRI